MEPKNVMLLGFVNKAIDYLDKHMDDQPDNTLTELKNIDLQSLKSELTENMDSSLDSSNPTVGTLLEAGEDSFDKFMDAASKKERITDKLDKMFDIDLDANEVPDEKESLEQLLDFYNLKDDMLLEPIELDHHFNKEEPKEEPKPVERKPLDKEEKLEKEFEQFVDNSFSEVYQEDVLKRVKRLENYVSNNPKFKDKNGNEIIYDYDFHDYRDEEELEDDFENFVGHSKNNNTIESIGESDSDETTFEMSEEDSRLMDLIARNVNRPQEVKKNEITGSDSKLDNIFSEVVSNEKEEPELDEIVDSDVIENLIDYATDDSAVSPVEKDDIIRLLRDMDVSQKNYYGDTDDTPTLNPYSGEVDIPYDYYESVQQQPGFVNSLIDDLRNKMIKEDEHREIIEKEYAQVFDRIHKTYPYLSSSFVKSVYELKDSINNEYPFNKKIIVLHRVLFRDVDYLRQFVEIALNHNFSINADEDKKIVDVFKEYMNSDGKIITSIFEVANQASLLGGEYDGYRVLYTQKVNEG